MWPSLHPAASLSLSLRRCTPAPHAACGSFRTTHEPCAPLAPPPRLALTTAPPLPPASPPAAAAEVQVPEARAFYAFQSAIETVHSEM